MTITYEELMERKLKMVGDRRDKRQGSLIFDALGPNAAETAALYADLSFLENRTFADTAEGEDLTRRCEERGVYRKKAVKATFYGKFADKNGKAYPIPQGSRFLLEELYYEVIGGEGDGRVVLECITEGEIGNRFLGELLPVGYFEGLAEAILSEIRTDGEDAEADEELRKRYMDSFSADAFGGNIADYRRRVMALESVGGVKVYPVWQGGGTVKLVVIDRGWRSPTEIELSRLQTEIDPQKSGEGFGIAPIGHKVTVCGVEEMGCKIQLQLVLEEGTDKETLHGQLEKSFEVYLQELRREWAEKEKLVVRTSYLEARALEIVGIIDVSACNINGSGANFILEKDQIPILSGIEVI